jgi:hypothetical protein
VPKPAFLVRSSLYAGPPMDALTAKKILSELWTLIDCARNRTINESERRQLEQLCDQLKSGLVGHPQFTAASDFLCLEIFSNGLFSPNNEPSVSRILRKIDQLRDSLK